MDARLLNPLLGVAIVTSISLAWDASKAEAQYYPSAQMIMPPPMAVMPQPIPMRGMGPGFPVSSPMAYTGNANPPGAWPAPSLPASGNQPSHSNAPGRPGRNGQAVAHSQNFIVFARDEVWAKKVSDTAEQLRKELAEHWLGRELQPWPMRCPLHVQDGEALGASGETRFVVSGGAATDWMMSVQGTRERVLDSVLPHEISHTIFATHFARLNKYVPRWADEGAATTVENEAEKKKHRFYLKKFLQTGRGLAFNEMFKLKEYPEDILPLYAQGHSAVQFLIDQSGPQQFIAFLEMGMGTEQWQAALTKYYDYQSIWEFQKQWNNWLLDGSPSDLVAYAPRLQKQSQASVVMASADVSRPNPGMSSLAKNSSSLPTDPRSLELNPSHLTPSNANTNLAANLAVDKGASKNAAVMSIPFDAGAEPVNNSALLLADSRTEGWFKTQLRQTSGQPATPIPAHNNVAGTGSSNSAALEAVSANGMTGLRGSQGGDRFVPASNSTSRPNGTQSPSIQAFQWEPSSRISGGPTSSRY